MVDLTSLKSRVAVADQPTTDQALIDDLWNALTQANDQAMSLQAQITTLQAQVSDLTAKLAAATNVPPVVITPPPVVAPPAPSSSADADFLTRRSAAGVVRSVSFDSAADLAGGFASNFGIFASQSNPAVMPTLDPTLKASGASSLMFTIPSLSSADSSGSYFTNFSPDLSRQFGENDVFYVQWRQRFSPEFLSTFFTGGGGWKQSIIGSGDQPNPAGGQPVLYFSASDLEVVTQNTEQRGYPQMYDSASGSASHSAFFPFEEPFVSALENSDFKMQNARPSPYCLFSSKTSATRFAPAGNCFPYFANEWMTFQARIKIGPRVGDEFVGSIVTLWAAREGEASEPLINFTINLSAGDPTLNQRFGKIWLLPYHTGKDATQVHPVCFTWYDELIISSQPIADPVVGTLPPEPTSLGSAQGAQALPAPTPTPAPTPSPTPAPAAGSGSALGALAASMASNSWADLATNNFNFALIDAGNAHSILEFATRGHWDPLHKKIQFWGMGHVSNQGLITYDDVSNTWSRDPGTGGLIPNANTFGHGYQHLALDPATGDLYQRTYDSGIISKKPYGAPWALVAPFDNSQTNQVSGALEWVPGENSGAGGLTFVDFGGVRISNPSVSAWGALKAALSGNLSNGSVAIAGALYFGGGDASSAFWKLNPATNLITPAAAAPIPFGATMADLIAHPNGVDALMVGPAGGNVYVYHSASNSWSVIGPHQLGANEWWVGISVPEYGVTVWLCEATSTSAPFIRVYKP
jgi:hypothetical protein